MFRVDATAHARLEEGLHALGLVLDADVRAGLLSYLQLLYRWNRRFNLTRVSPVQAVRRHLLDSLTLARHLRGSRVLDAGSGAGLPGVPLALARPDCEFLLNDSRDRRCRFLQQVLIELGIDNACVLEGRIETRSAQSVDCIVSRAFASLGELVSLTRHHLAAGGCWLALKGQPDDAELSGIPETITVRDLGYPRLPGPLRQRTLQQLEPIPDAVAAASAVLPGQVGVNST